MRSSNWLAFSLSPHLTIDVPDHAPSSQPNGPKMAQHPSAENGMAYNGPGSAEFYTGQSEGDGLPMRSDGSLCIMEALSRSQSGDWAQLKTGHVPHSQHLLPSELSCLGGSRAPSEQISQSQYDSISKSDHDTVPKLEDFLGGASSLGGQYTTRPDSQSRNLENMFFRDINVNLSPYSSGGGAQQQQQASHVPPSFHAYGLQRTDNSSSQQPYDSHSRTNTAAASGEPSNLCGHPNVHSQNLLQVALDQQQQCHHPGQLGTQHGGGGDMLSDCALQLPHPQASNLSALSLKSGHMSLNTWLRNQEIASPSAGGGVSGSGAQQQQGVNRLGSSAGDNKQAVVVLGGVVASSAKTASALSNLHPLSLSMSPGSQSSNSLQVGAQHVVQAETSPETRKRGAGRAGSKEASPRKSIDTFGQRTSVFRGVTRHRWTGRYEAHLWDNSCRKEGQTRKGRQVYLGGYDKEEKAARAYDLAALKYWGANTTINFPLHEYGKEIEEMKNMTRQEYVASLRRKSSGFSRGASVYRGVTRHHQHGRWQARIGRVAGNKDLYLGTYSTQEEAAEAYDIAAIKFRGINAVTNFDISRYDTKRICGTGQNSVETESKPLLSYGVSGSSKELQLVQQQVLQIDPHHQHHQQPNDVSVDQTDDDSQSLQTANTNASQVTDSGVLSSRNAQLQEWQLIYQQQTQRGWDESSHQHQHQQQQQQQHLQQQQQQQHLQQQQHHHQQQQDARTQSLISESLGHNYIQSNSNTSNMHSAVLRNLMGPLLGDGGASHSTSETSGGGGMICGMPGGSSGGSSGNNNLMGGVGTGGGYSHGGQSPKHNSSNTSNQLGLNESDEDSKNFDSDLSRQILYMQSQKQQQQQQQQSSVVQQQQNNNGSQSSSVNNNGYDHNNNSLVGSSSWMNPQATGGAGGGGLGVGSGRANLSVGSHNLPIFAVWND